MQEAILPLKGGGAEKTENRSAWSIGSENASDGEAAEKRSWMVNKVCRTPVVLQQGIGEFMGHCLHIP